MPRLCAVGSLVLLAGYASLVWLSSNADGTAFNALEPFPLGGSAGSGGLALRAVALVLGLLLGWGVPGLSLAFLTKASAQSSALLGRAFGLGIGYIFVTSLCYALALGHAPHRGAFLVLLALPAALLAFRPPPREPSARSGVAVGLAFLAMVAVVAVLWSKLRYEGMNGDGTEVYELSRSLEANRLPRWDLEGPPETRRFGIPIVVPLVTTGFPIFGEMMVLGRSELASRLLFVSSLVILALTATGLAARRTASAWMYALALSAVYALWNAYYVGYEPPYDLAHPAGTDTLTTALWLVGVRELVAGSTPLGVSFMLLASGTTYSGPILTVLALGFLWLVNRERGSVPVRWAAASAVLIGVTVGLVGWRSGYWPDWIRQFRREYWTDFVEPGRRVAAQPFVSRLALLSGGLPLLVPFAWKRLSTAGRVLILTGVAYLAIVMSGSYKNLHYFMPLPWIFLAPAIEASTPRLRSAAAALLAGVFMASWPNDRAIRMETIELGRASCIEGFDYESAALAADPIYEALLRPNRGDRFAVGKHTFVRYAMELGGHDCVLGLSRTVPPEAIPLVDGSASFAWTTNPDRFARWRLHTVPIPTSAIFPRPARPIFRVDANAWTERIHVAGDPARQLLITGFGADSGGEVPLEALARLLAPVPRSTNEVWLGLRAPQAVRVEVLVNGERASDLLLEPGRQDTEVRARWRHGWNIVELRGAEGVGLEWLEARPTRPREATSAR